MDQNDMIKEAIARYRRLHEDIERAHASYSEYLRIFNWLLATRQMFPEAFSDFPSDPTPTLPSPPQPKDLPRTDMREFEDSPPALKAVTNLMMGVKNIHESLTLSARRALNEEALALVHEILVEKGPLKLDSIIEQMHLRKWSGYPTDDPVNLYNALQTRARRNDRFVNLGENKWGLIQLPGGEP